MIHKFRIYRITKDELKIVTNVKYNTLSCNKIKIVKK